MNPPPPSKKILEEEVDDVATHLGAAEQLIDHLTMANAKLDNDN